MNLFSRWLEHEARFDVLLRTYRERADHIMIGMNAFLLAVCVALAPWYGTWLAVLTVGVPTLILAFILGTRYAGTLITRLYMAAAFMVFTGLIIHQSEGMTEAHFAAFGLIGILLYYRDWRTIAMATLVIYLHHLILGYTQTLGVPVYVFDGPEFWTLFWVHVAYFLPFIAMMIYLSIWLRREAYQDQHVIEMAQDIMQGDLISDQQLPDDVRDAPLIQAVVQMKNRLLDLLRVMPVPAAVIRLDNETVVNTNEAWSTNMGLTAPGASVRDTLICSVPGTWEELVAELQSSPDRVLDKKEISLRLPNGQEGLFEVSVVLHEESQPVMAILTMEDITQRRRTEQTMQRLAFHDMLTDLPNRTRLLQVLEQGLRAWERDGQPLAVLLMDLDGFKPVNDTHGHDAGDEVLRVVAQWLRHAVQADDLVARLGGDEFVVVLQGYGNGEAAREVGQWLLEHMARTMELETAGITVQVGGSVGIAHVGQGARDVDDLLKQADVALYQAKGQGKGVVSVYDPSRAATG